MKTTTDIKIDAVKYMREQRQLLADKLAGLTKEEIIEYFKKRKKLNTVKPSA